MLCGTNDGSNAGDRYRTVLPDCHVMFVYDAGRAIGAKRPEELAYIALEFFERRDLLLVSRENGVASLGSGAEDSRTPPCTAFRHSGQRDGTGRLSSPKPKIGGVQPDVGGAPT